MARKRKYIDRKLMKELALCQLTNDEMARALRVSPETLERRYAATIKAWKQQGVGSVRRKLYSRAMDDSNSASTTSMIFFLKNYGGLNDGLKDHGDNKPLATNGLPQPSEFTPRVAGSHKPN